jgi:hypothetical protein
MFTELMRGNVLIKSVTILNKFQLQNSEEFNIVTLEFLKYAVYTVLRKTNSNPLPSTEALLARPRPCGKLSIKETVAAANP